MLALCNKDVDGCAQTAEGIGVASYREFPNSC